MKLTWNNFVVQKFYEMLGKVLLIVWEMSARYFRAPGGCFTNVSRGLQDILLKFVYCRNHSSHENFMLKLCTCAQSHALGTRTKFQLEIHTINVISSIVYFREIILESSRNVSETTPWLQDWPILGLKIVTEQ